MGVVRRAWTNNETRVWLLRANEEPAYLGDAGLQDVRIGGALGATWECAYCGSTMQHNALSCTACNAPRKTRSRTAAAMLIGFLPFISWLDSIQDGFTLEIRGGHCSSPLDYSAGYALARIKHCCMGEKVIPSLSMFCGEDIQACTLEISISGDFSFVDAEYDRG